jgi:hypothetical protein
MTGAVSAREALSLSNSQVLGASGAGLSAYQIIDSWGNSCPQVGAIQGASLGAYLGSYFTPLGTVIGGVLGGVVGGVFGCIKSGKHKDQKARDAVRDHFKDIGMIDENHCLELSDGSRYNIGFDGGHRYRNLDGGKRAPYQVDSSNPLLHETVGWVQPLAALLTGGDEKLRTDFAGYFTNAALSNAETHDTARLNVLSIFDKMALRPEDALSGLVAIYQQGRITKAELIAYTNGLVCLLEGRMSNGEELLST